MSICDRCPNNNLNGVAVCHCTLPYMFPAFEEKLADSQIDLEPGISEIVNENFWELVEG